jgi:hypothetical protein
VECMAWCVHIVATFALYDVGGEGRERSGTLQNAY